jgi:O-antigen/teichoic acid export membrane protein
MVREPETVSATEFIGTTDNGRPAISVLSKSFRSSRLCQGATALADQMIASATTFLTGAIVARLCVPEEFGAYSLGFSFIALLMGVQASLICTPYMVASPRLLGPNLRSYTGSVFVHAVLLGIVASIGLGTATAAAALSGTASITLSALSAVTIVLTIMLLRDCIRQVCFARLNITAALVFDLGLAFLQFGGLATLGATGFLSAFTAFLVLGGSSGIAAVTWIWIHWPELEIAFHQVWSDWNKAWKTGKCVFASGLLWGIAMNVYIWIIGYFHGAAETAVWAASFGVITLINPLLLGVQNVLGPKIALAFAQSGIGGMRRFVIQSALAFFAVMAAFAVAMLITGDPIVALIYGPQYAGQGLLVALLAANTALITLGFSPSRGLFTIERADVDLKINGLALAMLLIMGVPMVKLFGPIGAAVAQLSTSAVAAAVRWAAFSTLTRSTFEAARA